MQKVSRVVLTATVLTAFGACIRTASVQAFPAFTKKEEKPCAYCHVNPNGGGKRNYRGMYYKAHNLSFAEFDDAAEAKKAGVEVAPDPDPSKKPTSYTPAKTTETPAGETKPAPASEKKLTTKEASARVAAARADLAKAPKDAAKKKALGAALSDLAHTTMLDQGIAASQRYKSAWTIATEALKYDPTNAQAKTDKKAIEDAYKSMGKAVPKA